MRVLLWVLIIGGILFLIGWAFLFESYEVRDNAMAPNLIRGDKVLVYLHASQDTGTPVICQHPSKADEMVVGRIVGKHGDELKIARDNLYVNGSQAEATIEDEYVLVDERDTGAPRTLKLRERIETLGMIRYRILWPEKGSSFSRRLRMRQTTVPPGRYYLLADNRAFGDDSRVYGPVEISSCIGRPLLVYQPAETSGDASSGNRWFSIVR